MKFLEFYLYDHISCEICHLFSRTSMRNFLWCYYGWFTTSLALEKCKKECIFFKLFWYKFFVHWKLKLINFLMDSVLNLKVQFLWDTWTSHERTWIRCFFFLPSFGLFWFVLCFYTDVTRFTTTNLAHRGRQWLGPFNNIQTETMTAFNFSIF